MWYKLCATVGGFAVIAAVALGILVFGKKKKQLMPHFLAAIALFVGSAVISGPAPESNTDVAQTPPPIVSQEPDRTLPSASQSAFPVESAMVSLPVEEPTPSVEQLENMARTYLADTFQLDLAEFRRGQGFEATISIPGISDQEGLEWAPENWEDIQLSLISAQSRLSEALEMPDTPSVLLVKDAAGELLLSVQQGRVGYNALKPEPEPTPESSPEPEPTPTPNRGPTDSQPSEAPSQQQTTTTYVLNTNTKKFHIPSCSAVPTINAENYSIYSGTRSGVISMGYDPCGRCKP